MSNKTQLQTNNTKLDALITRVNAAKDVAASLPEAGGGGGVSLETSSVTIECSFTRYAVSYTSVDSSGNVIYKTDTNFAYPYTITCLKNSCVAISHGDSSPMFFLSGATLLFNRSYYASFGISNDIATLKINNGSGGSDD